MWWGENWNNIIIGCMITGKNYMFSCENWNNVKCGFMKFGILCHVFVKQLRKCGN